MVSEPDDVVILQTHLMSYSHLGEGIKGINNSLCDSLRKCR